MDTNGAEEVSLLVRWPHVHMAFIKSLGQYLHCVHVDLHARVVLGVGKGVLYREVPSVQECPYA